MNQIRIDQQNPIGITLHEIYNDLGYTNLSLTYNYMKDGEKRFTKWVKFHDLIHLEDNDFVPDQKINITKKEYMQRAQHRSVLDIELMFDIDDEYIKRKRKEYRFKDIQTKSVWIYKDLIKYGLRPVISFTGSKSYHISLIVKKLRGLHPIDRVEIKKKILRHYGADSMKGSETCLISLENSKHYKSGKRKREVFLDGQGFSEHQTQTVQAMS